MPIVALAFEKRFVQSSNTGANLLILLNRRPYFMNRNGTGSARHATAPRILPAGPTPSRRNIGLAASGSPNAKNERRNVLAETELAA